MYMHMEELSDPRKGPRAETKLCSQQTAPTIVNNSVNAYMYVYMYMHMEELSDPRKGPRAETKLCSQQTCSGHVHISSNSTQTQECRELDFTCLSGLVALPLLPSALARGS